jgi:hypothetical protein
MRFNQLYQQQKYFYFFGTGHEEHVGVGDKPGFECDPHPSITPEGHGFTKHLVFRSPRNTRRMVQTSLFITQVLGGGGCGCQAIVIPIESFKFLS